MTRINEKYRRLTTRAKKEATIRSSHYVCFDCRKQFQKPSAAQYAVGPSGRPHAEFVGFDSYQLTYPCPQCGKELRLIGKSFRAPRQDDTEGWRVAEMLLDAGFGYWGMWGPYPTRLKDVAAFIDKHRQKTVGERILDQWGEKP